jgi:hypothetical protein
MLRLYFKAIQKYCKADSTINLARPQAHLTPGLTLLPLRYSEEGVKAVSCRQNEREMHISGKG